MVQKPGKHAHHQASVTIHVTTDDPTNSAAIHAPHAAANATFTTVRRRHTRVTLQKACPVGDNSRRERVATFE